VRKAICRNLLRRAANDSGQAMVESAMVIPMMTFLILAIIQLVMVQHAKVMTEYAAFNAARAGIVWNADKIIMENAAIISLLPTYEGLFKESDLGNPAQMLKRILQRALLYQLNRRLPQAIDLLKNGANNVINQLPIPGQGQEELSDNINDLLDKAEATIDEELREAITGALGKDDDSTMVQVTLLNPTQDTFGQRGRELDFDDFSQRDATRLSIRVRYLYMMRVPFANWIIHQAWLANRAGQELYGAIWNPQEDAGETGFRSVAPVQNQTSGDELDDKLAALADQGVYLVPLYATYTMRMQSNPYKQGTQVK
jgi:hypothetical protein